MLIEENDERLKVGICLQRKIQKQEWDVVKEGEVWVKFMYTAPESRGEEEEEEEESGRTNCLCSGS